MTARRDLASEAVRTWVLYRRSRAAFYAARDAARRSGLFDLPGTRELALIDDEQIGAVVVEPGRWEARITDEAALLHWAHVIHPEWSTDGTLLAHIAQVRHSIREAEVWLDEATAVLWDEVPGIERVRADETWLSIRPVPDAAATIAANAPEAVRACLAHLDAELRELDGAPEGQRGECLDGIATAARTLRDELLAGAVLGALGHAAPVPPAPRAGA